MMIKLVLCLCLNLQVASSFFFQAWQFRHKDLHRLNGAHIKGDELPDDSVIDEILRVAIKASKAAGSIIKDNSDGSAVVEKKSTSRDLLSKNF